MVRVNSGLDIFIAPKIGGEVVMSENYGRSDKAFAKKKKKKRFNITPYLRAISSPAYHWRARESADQVYYQD